MSPEINAWRQDMLRRADVSWMFLLLALVTSAITTGCASLAGGPVAPSPPTIIEGNEPSLLIRDLSRDNAPNAARIELLERAGRRFDGGAFLHWNGEEDQLLIGTRLEGDDTSLLVLDRSESRIGVGTTMPRSLFDVDGTVTTRNLVVEATGPNLALRDVGGDNRSNAARLDLLERAGGRFDGGGFLRWNGEDDRMIFGTQLEGVDSSLIVLDRRTQSVGIGTATPQSRLAVDGQITAREVNVTVDGWPDDVFEADYVLLPLEELEHRIREDGHLPGVPSAVDVAAAGVAVGSMQSTLLRKIEELTLYLLELRRLNQDLAFRLGALEDR